MKILFSADLHIKLGQKNVPIDWQKARFTSLVEQLNKIPCDLMVIGGDIFDRIPTIEELELYFSLVAAIKHKTIMFSGNHEMVKKNTTFLTKLKLVTQAVNPLVEIIDDFLSIENMDFIPYNKLREPWPKFTNNILFIHVRGEIPPHVKPEIDLSILGRWDLVLAGDLHSHSNSQRNIVYPGSPLTTHFHRKEVETGVVLLDSDSLNWEFVKLELPQLLRKTVTSIKDMVPSTYHHTIYELEGNVGELANIGNPELLDKKLVKREYRSSLNLRGLTIRDELAIYLKEVLKIENAEEILKEANDIIKEPILE